MILLRLLIEAKEIRAKLNQKERGEVTLYFNIPKTNFENVGKLINKAIKKNNLYPNDYSGTLLAGDSTFYYEWTTNKWSAKNNQQYVDALKTVGINVVGDIFKKQISSKKSTKIIPNAKKQLSKAYGKIYDYEDDGLEMLDDMAAKNDLDDVYDKWINKKSITDLEASQLLQLFMNVKDELKNT